MLSTKVEKFSVTFMQRVVYRVKYLRISVLEIYGSGFLLWSRRFKLKSLVRTVFDSSFLKEAQKKGW